MPSPLRQVDEWTLRSLYREERLAERLSSGDLYSLVLTSAPASKASEQPRGTASQLVGYFDAHSKVAEVHQFVHPDGSIGGSGEPDPKMVVSKGVRYVLRR